MKRTRVWLIACLCLVFGGAVLVFVLSPTFTVGHMPILAPGRRLAVALLEYANAHEGEFPNSLSDLPAGSVSHDELQFHDPQNHEVHDWIYFKNRSTRDSHETILFVSPPAGYKHQGRVVWFTDGSGCAVRETQFQELVRQQQNQK